MAEETRRKIPARYLGPGGMLKGGPYYNADGSRRETNMLSRGDILLLDESEVRGHTYKREADGQFLTLGAGKVVKPEHQGCTPEALDALGYEFHAGRPDFEPVEGQGQPSVERAESTPAAAPVPEHVLDVSGLPGVEILPDAPVQHHAESAAAETAPAQMGG